jgi:uncharacterized FAD-dependent dehydrogenase
MNNENIIKNALEKMDKLERLVFQLTRRLTAVEKQLRSLKSKQDQQNNTITTLTRKG